MTSQSGTAWESQTGVANGTPTYGTYETDGESGYQRANPVDPNAREHKPIRSLAYATNCRYCDSPVYVAICRDGKWRSFETALVPPAPSCVWAWRKRYGMEETELTHGHHLHYCAGYHAVDLSAFLDELRPTSEDQP